MASTIVECELPVGSTATLELYADGSDTLANTGGADTLTAGVNRITLYTATVTEALTGLHFAQVKSGGNVLRSGWVVLQDDTRNYKLAGDPFTAITADRAGYFLTVATGTCANPQNAAAVYTLTNYGDTFTVTHAGLTSAGVRTGQTLAKT